MDVGKFLGSAVGIIIAGVIFLGLIYLAFGKAVFLGFFFMFVLIGVYDYIFALRTGKTVSRTMYEAYKRNKLWFTVAYFILMVLFAVVLYIHFINIE